MNIRKECKKRRISLEEFADIVGVSLKTVYNWENLGIPKKSKVYAVAMLAKFDADCNSLA